MSVDVVVVGAGVNSLVAAHLLGSAGLSVVVVDRNDQPGGAVRTLELTLPGFRHDIGAMNLGAFVGSPFHAQFGAELASHGFEIAMVDRPYGSAFAGGRFVGISTDRSANLRVIADIDPSDAIAWQRWGDDFDAGAPVLGEVFASAPPPGGPLEALSAVGGDPPGEVGSMLRAILVDSLRTNLGRRFASEEVRALIAAWGLHLDYAPDVAGGCWMPFLETNADERNGIPIARGGSGRLIDALVAMVGATGGEVRTGLTVEQIAVHRGRATGVRLAGGEQIEARRGVVASVTPPALARLTGDALPAVTATRAGNWRFGPGTMVIHLALSAPLRWLAGAAADDSFYVHIGPSLDHLATVYEQGLAGTLAREPFCVVAQPTRYDPHRAPDGQHVLWIMVRAVPAVIRGDVLERIEGPRWTESATEMFADRVLDVVETHAPGLRDLIIARRVIAPPDLEGLNPNLVGGDLNAGSMHLDQFYGERSFAARSPVPGLYMCGASTWPGGGTQPISGMLVADVVLEDAAR